MLTVANFIDAGYLHKIKERFNAPRLDYDRLVRTMANSQRMFSTYYYDCLPPRFVRGEGRRFWEQRRFLDSLRQIPRFYIRLGRLTARHCPYCQRRSWKQKCVDTQLAVDMTLCAAKGMITTMSLFTGDTDFIPAVQAARKCGVKVHLFHACGVHRDLINACNYATLVTPAFFQRIAAGPLAASA